MILAMGSFSVVVGALGVLTSRAKSCFSVGLFSFMSFIGFVVFISFGGLLLSVDIASHKAIDDYCDNKESN